MARSPLRQTWQQPRVGSQPTRRHHNDARTTRDRGIEKKVSETKERLEE